MTDQQKADPRLIEWGYGSTEEAITHLGKLLEDQAAFDGLGASADLQKVQIGLDMDLLLANLRKVESGVECGPGQPDHGGATNWHRNPEGPAAADLIEALRADLKAADATATKWMRAAGRVAATSEEWKARAIEAERKLAEARDENTRWALHFADIREAAGIGHKPMLSEVPDAIRAMRAERDEAVALLREIDEVPYTGPEWPKNRARTFLQSIVRETGK